MNNPVNDKIQVLIGQWTELIDAGERISKEKANESRYGPNKRIRRTIGEPIIFDFNIYKNQQKIQNALCYELPQYINIIRSKPEIMDGYTWTCNDYIDLYFEHYRLVVEKLQQIISKKVNM